MSEQINLAEVYDFFTKDEVAQEFTITILCQVRYFSMSTFTYVGGTVTESKQNKDLDLENPILILLI